MNRNVDVRHATAIVKHFRTVAEKWADLRDLDMAQNEWHAMVIDW